jgi:hypothetical protein
MATLQQILLPQTILGVITRIREGQGRLSRLFGMGMKGKNHKNIKGRYASFRIFDHSRVPSMFRAPDTGPATINLNPIGTVFVQMARMHEKTVLGYEQLSNLSPLAGPNAQIDPGGADYIMKQETYLAEHLNNAHEFMVAGMTRGVFYLKLVGENYIPYLTQPTGNFITVNYQIPAGNLGQLNMTGAGAIITTSWADPAAKILQNILDIQSAFAQLTGRTMKHAVTNSTTWKSIITNTEVRTIAGINYTPFETFERTPEKDFDGEETTEFYAILRGDPTVQWHLINDVLAIDGVDPSYSAGTATLTKVVQDNHVIFSPPFESMPLWAQMVYGSEYVVEYPNLQAPTERTGPYAWHRFTDQPSAIELIAICNALPVLEAPKNLANGTVIF